MEKELEFNDKIKKAKKLNKFLSWILFWKKNIKSNTSQVVSSLELKKATTIINENSTHSVSMSTLNKIEVEKVDEIQFSPLEIKVNEIIEKEKWDELEYIVKYGYVYTNSQIQKLEIFIDKNYPEIKITDESYQEFKKFNERKLNLPESFRINHFLKIIGAFDFYYYINKLYEINNFNKSILDINSEFKNLMNNTYYFIKKPEKLYFLLEESQNIFKTYENINEITNKILDKIEGKSISKNENSFKSFCVYFLTLKINDLDNQTYNRVRELCLQMKNRESHIKFNISGYKEKSFSQILSEMDAVRNKEISSEILELIKSELINNNSLAHTITKHVKEEKERIDSRNPLEDLPLESKEMLKNMEMIYINILKDKEYIEKIELLTLSDIIEKKIPKLILNFTAFNISDRIEMKNLNGKNPIEICNNAFTNFLEIFHQAQENIKSNKLRNLSVMERVSTGIKNKGR
jgi:hypothetical protein